MRNTSWASWSVLIYVYADSTHTIGPWLIYFCIMPAGSVVTPLGMCSLTLCWVSHTLQSTKGTKPPTTEQQKLAKEIESLKNLEGIKELGVKIGGK